MAERGARNFGVEVRVGVGGLLLLRYFDGKNLSEILIVEQLTRFAGEVNCRWRVQGRCRSRDMFAPTVTRRSSIFGMTHKLVAVQIP